MNTITKKGFTLIELLIVIAIIAILSAILFPVFATAREKARQSSCASNLKQITLGITQYYQDNDECLPIAYAANDIYGASIASYNTGAKQVGGVAGAPTGPAVQILSYIKSTNVFDCPDDHPIASACSSGCELKSGSGNDVPDGYSGTVAGLTYAQLWNSLQDQQGCACAAVRDENNVPEHGLRDEHFLHFHRRHLV